MGQDNQKSFYSGKKKRRLGQSGTSRACPHTLKAQIIADHLSRKIISVHTSAGSVHDFKLFKQSIRKMHSQTVCFADSGYQGLAKRHARGYTPKKGSKHHPLTDTDKAYNRMLSGYRIVIENILCCLKVFRILSEKYRNRRKRYAEILQYA